MCEARWGWCEVECGRGSPEETSVAWRFLEGARLGSMAGDGSLSRVRCA